METAEARELAMVYATMSEGERQAEIAWAEEGLRGSPRPDDAFPGEDNWPWWE